MKTLSLLLFLLVPLASSSQAQSHSAVVKHTPDGFVIVDVSDTPVTDASAVLLTARADGEQGWSLRVLRLDETPSEVLASRDREADVVVMQPNDRDYEEAYDALDRSRAALQDARRAMRQSQMTLRSARVSRGEIIEREDRMDVVGDGEIVDERVYGLVADVRGPSSRGGVITEQRAHHEMALKLAEDGADRARIIHDYHRDRIARRRARTEDIGAGEITEILDDADVRGGEILDAEVTRLTDTARGVLRSIQVSGRGPLAVRHQLTAELDHALGLDDPIVAALVDDEALYSLDISDSGDRTSVEIVFGFETQEAWEAWLSQPASTEALLTLRERATDSKVHTHVRAGLR